MVGPDIRYSFDEWSARGCATISLESAIILGRAGRGKDIGDAGKMYLRSTQEELYHILGAIGYDTLKGVQQKKLLPAEFSMPDLRTAEFFRNVTYDAAHDAGMRMGQLPSELLRVYAVCEAVKTGQPTKDAAFATDFFKNLEKRISSHVL